MDYKIFLALNSLAGKNHFFDLLIIFLAKDLVYAVIIILALWWLFGRNKMRTRKALVMAFVSFVAARLVLTEIIRAIYHRNRPFLSHTVTQLVAKDSEASFPSGHASAMFAIATAIYFYNKKAGWLLLILGLIIGLARIIAGIHYPSDVLGGAILGVITAWFIEKFSAKKMDGAAENFSRISDRFFNFYK